MNTVLIFLPLKIMDAENNPAARLPIMMVSIFLFDHSYARNGVLDIYYKIR